MALQGRERRKKRKRFTLLLDSSITTKFASYPKDSGSQVRGCTYKFVRNDRSENCILKEFLWKCKVLSRCRKSEKEGERERAFCSGPIIEPPSWSQFTGCYYIRGTQHFRILFNQSYLSSNKYT